MIHIFSLLYYYIIRTFVLFQVEKEHLFAYNVNEVKIMNVLIEIIYIGWQNEILRKGNFLVNTKKFKEDPDHTVAEVALKWIHDIRVEGHISKIIRVRYNGENDITELVEELDK